MKKIRINIRPKKTGDKILLLAWISTGQTHIDESFESLFKIIDKSHPLFGKHVSGQKLRTLGLNSKDKYVLEKVRKTKKVYDYLIISTGLSLSKHFWLATSKSAKAPYEYINGEIARFKKYVEELYESMCKDSLNVSHEQFKKQIEEWITPQIRATNRMFTGELKKSQKNRSGGKKEKIITPAISKNELPVINIPTYYGGIHSETGIRTNFIDYIAYKIDLFTLQGPYVSRKVKSTLTSYKNLKQVLTRYKDNTDIQYDIKTFTIDDCKTLISWFINTGQVTKSGEPFKPYSQNYLETIKKNIHGFLMKASEDDDIPLSPKAKLLNEYWNNKWLKQNDPYLTYEQIDKLKKLKFGKKSQKEIELIQQKKLKYVEEDTLELCCKMFIVNCENGFRFSDQKRLKHLYKEGSKYYFVNVSEKTNIQTKKPVRDTYVIDLYEKTYNKEFKFPITEQCYNRAIKVLCFRAGFTEPVQLYGMDMKSGDRSDSNKPLWSCCTSKTARKSMVSNEVYENYTPLPTVASWGGWKSETSLRNYLQLTPAQYAEIGERTYQMLLEAKKLKT